MMSDMKVKLIVMALDLLIGYWPVYMYVSQFNLLLKPILITGEI
jgi:hypothetical protein